VARAVGWRRLHLLFHLLFVSAVAGLVALAVWTDRRGYEQVRSGLAEQLQASSDLFVRALATGEGRAALAQLEFHAAPHPLHPLLLDAHPRVMQAVMGADYLVAKACYLHFQPVELAAMDACAVAERAPAARGRLYLLVRFAADQITPHLQWGAPITHGDYFRLEVVRAHGRARRWLVVLDRYSKPALIEAHGFAPPWRVDPESYQLTAYAADEHWAVPALLLRRADAGVNGSMVSAAAPMRERAVAVSIDMAELLAADEHWPVPSDSVILRIAHFLGSGAGKASTLLGATYLEPGTDLMGTPLLSVRDLYDSAGLGETVTLTLTRDSGTVDSRAAPIWSARLDQTENENLKRTSGSMWRRPWLGATDIAVVGRHESNPAYLVHTSLPAQVALAGWNRFAPKLAMSFLAVLGIILVLYAVTMGAVLSRLMRLAAAAADTAQGTDHLRLPYAESGDELGLLSRRLTRLLEQSRDEASLREAETQRRMKHEYETLRVIGHHIRSPIQALLALNPPESSSWPYIERINKAVQAVFGGDALRDAFSRMYGEPVRIELVEFLGQLASNAVLIGVPNVLFRSAEQAVFVEVDDGALADALVQILNNAHRFRRPGTIIELSLTSTEGKALISITNQGPVIAEHRLEEIFQFGVSLGAASPDHQGQGLFVARELAAKMNGNVVARNLDDGVVVELVIPTQRGS